jgi:hypothetical protein
MSTVPNKNRQRFETQGYLGLSDATFAEVGPWLRLSPAICMAWVAIATYYKSTTALLVLIPFAVLGAFLPRHPFDAIYNYGIRHLLGTPLLPHAKAPRKFACKIAVVWISLTSWAFYSGVIVLGYVLGGSFALAAALTAFTDFCIPSYFYGLIFGKPKIADADGVQFWR